MIRNAALRNKAFFDRLNLPGVKGLDV